VLDIDKHKLRPIAYSGKRNNGTVNEHFTTNLCYVKNGLQFT